MGWARKIAGGQNAQKAAIRAAEEQAAAIREQARQAADQAKWNAMQAAMQQQMLSARQQAEATATDLMNRPAETASVVLNTPGTETLAQTRKKTQNAFGRSYADTGVNI